MTSKSPPNQPYNNNNNNYHTADQHQNFHGASLTRTTENLEKIVTLHAPYVATPQGQVRYKAKLKYEY